MELVSLPSVLLKPLVSHGLSKYKWPEKMHLMEIESSTIQKQCMNANRFYLVELMRGRSDRNNFKNRDKKIFVVVVWRNIVL